MTLVLGHRGSSARAPENTLEAFRAARDDGADGVELDVHRSADGVLVVHHDAASPGLGVLAELTAAAIREADLSIPTLAEALDELSGLLVNVEVKNLPPDLDYDPQHRAVDSLVELLAARDDEDRVLVSSFNLDTVDRVRVLDPTIPTGFLTYGMEPGAAVGLAVEHGHGAWHPDRATLAREPMEMVALAHGADLEVNVWTVNEPDELAGFAKAGVDAIVTDVPEVAVRAISGRRA